MEFIAVHRGAIAKENSDENDQTLHSLSRELGIIPPTLDRRLRKDELQLTRLGRLLEYSQGLWSDREVPKSREIDPVDFPNGLGNIPLIELVNEGNDLICRIHGTNVAEISTFSLTGKTIPRSTIPPGSQEFCPATYKVGCTRHAPISR